MAATFTFILMYLEIIWLVSVAVAASSSFCGRGSLIPFSGFKIHRQYRIDGPVPTNSHFIILSHCVRGNLESQEVVRLESITDIDWKVPICTRRVQGHSEGWLRKGTSSLKTILSVKNTASIDTEAKHNSLTQTLITKARKVKHRFRAKAEGFYENLIQLLSSTLPPRTRNLAKLQDQRNTTMSLQESAEYVCYKMARRRKYARSNLSFYIPETFVGALYECSVTEDPPIPVDSYMTPSSSAESLACDSSLSKPIAPLIADKVAGQWVDFSFNIFKPSLIHTIPFMTTAGPLDLRFANPNAPDTAESSWATQIRVNEDYDYSKADLHLLTRAVAMTTDKIFKVMKPIDFNHLLKRATFESNYTIPSPVIDCDFSRNRVKQLPLAHKASLLLALNATKYLPKLNQVQLLWDSIIDFI